MKATDFTRDDCQLGKNRRTYNTLMRDYRCTDCGHRLTMLWTENEEDYPENWHVACAACGGTDFTHERAIERQKSDAIEVIDGLPEELRKEILGWH